MKNLNDFSSYCYSSESESHDADTGTDTVFIADEHAEKQKVIFHDNIAKVYVFGPEIGKGRFGSVRIAQRISLGNSYKFAIKSIPRKHVDESSVRVFLHELEILKSLDHPNIIEFHELYVDKYYFHIVMELCYGMNLFDYIQSG